MINEGVDAKHIAKVLRMRIGEKIQIVSDDGVTAIAEISSLEQEQVNIHCLEVLSETHEPKVFITLAQGLTKGSFHNLLFQVKGLDFRKTVSIKQDLYH